MEEVTSAMQKDLVVVCGGRAAGDRQLRQPDLSGGVFFFNDTATTEIYTLSLHDALPIRAGEVYDINSHTIAGVVQENGGEPKLAGRAPDRLATLQIALKKAAANDLVVVSGGSSVGEKDLVAETLESIGNLLFHGIAMKPGRPTALGLVDGTAVLGLPGNPTSCLSNGYVLLAPMLRRIARLPPARETVIEVPLAMQLASKIGRVEFHTVRIVDGQAVPASKESGAITSMAHADGYVEIPADVEGIEKGEIVRVVLF